VNKKVGGKVVRQDGIGWDGMGLDEGEMGRIEV